MVFLESLIPGKFVRRYKRFLADIQFHDNTIITAHCPNSGSMKGLLETGNQVYVWKSDNPKRKLAYTWELVRTNGVWVGINTNRPHQLIHEAIQKELIPEFDGFTVSRREVRYGAHSRLDLLLTHEDKKCYVELKNVTLVEDNIAMFPDAVTIRGTRHMEELIKITREGNRGAVAFIIQRADAKKFRPAKKIDPNFANVLKKAAEQGVEVYALKTEVSPRELSVVERIPVEI